jgi:hypothetical protein
MVLLVLVDGAEGVVRAGLGAAHTARVTQSTDVYADLGPAMTVNMSTRARRASPSLVSASIPPRRNVCGPGAREVVHKPASYPQIGFACFQLVTRPGTDQPDARSARIPSTSVYAADR